MAECCQQCHGQRHHSGAAPKDHGQKLIWTSGVCQCPGFVPAPRSVRRRRSLPFPLAVVVPNEDREWLRPNPRHRRSRDQIAPGVGSVVKEVRANRFVLGDDAGKVRAVLRGDTPSLRSRPRGQDDKIRFVLVVDAQGIPRLDLQGADDTRRVVLSVFPSRLMCRLRRVGCCRTHSEPTSRSIPVARDTIAQRRCERSNRSTRSVTRASASTIIAASFLIVLHDHRNRSVARARSQNVSGRRMIG